MLKKISIQNLGLIAHAEIFFPPGFSVITGETGAGKSFFCRAIELAMGGRKTEKWKENEKTILELEWENHVFRRILEEKRSRFFVDDIPETLETAEKILGNFLHFHGQHETAFLRSPEAATEIFDAACVLQNPHFSREFSDFSKFFQQWKNACAEKNELEKTLEKSILQKDFWEFQAEKMQAVSFSLEEFFAAEKCVESTKEQEKNRIFVEKIVTILGGEEHSVLGQLNESERLLHKMEQPILAEKISSAFEVVQDVVSALEKNMPAFLEEEEEAKKLVHKVNTLVRSFGVISAEQLLEKKYFFQNALQEYATMEENHKILEEKCEELLRKATEKAEVISRLRKEVVENFPTNVEEKCRLLGMPPARFVVEFLPTSLQKMGLEKVQFLFSANKNSPLQPLHAVASGGEMARVMLALKQFFPKNATLIFDEIDTGVSGAIAEKMGEEMKLLAENRQIISISHLPQIAAKADHHFVVEKIHGENSTHTIIRKVEGEERIQKIAAMLSGEKISEAALEAARKMM